jgi:Tol biopolymer transport system component
VYRYRQNTSPWPRLILILAIGLAIVAAAFVVTLPRVTNTTPQGNRVSSLSPVTFMFNTDMDQASVESRVHISPVVPGQFVWAGRTLQFVPQAEWPVGNVQVSLDSGAVSVGGLSTLYGADWQFTVGAAGIAYLQITGDTSNIFALPLLTNAQPQQVTTERFGVNSFSLTPDTLQFIYSATRLDGGADLKRINRDGTGIAVVLDCPTDRCTAPVVSPDSTWLAFERHPLTKLDQSTVELMNLTTGQTTVIDDNPAHISRFPAFSPDGRLAYLNIFEQFIVIYNPADGESTQIPNTSGQMGTWSPDGESLLFPEITSGPPATQEPGTPAPVLQIDTFFSHLRQVDTVTGDFIDLSGATAVVEDANAVYSADGQWLAFGRKKLEQDLWTPGRQLWVMPVNGSPARALTNDPLYNHSNFVWSPDGEEIVYVRFDVTDPASTTEVWTIGVDGLNPQKLATGGFLPMWLP